MALITRSYITYLFTAYWQVDGEPHTLEAEAYQPDDPDQGWPPDAWHVSLSGGKDIGVIHLHGDGRIKFCSFSGLFDIPPDQVVALNDWLTELVTGKAKAQPEREFVTGFTSGPGVDYHRDSR